MAYSQNLPSTVLEAGSAKSRCQQGRFSLGAVRQDVVQPLSPSGALLAVSGVGSQLDHPNPSSRGGLLLSCLSASFLCKRRAVMLGQGLPGGASGEESTCQSRRCKSRGLDPWVGKIPWKRAWQHSRVLAWRILRTEEPGGLQSTGSQRVGHD